MNDRSADLIEQVREALGRGTAIRIVGNNSKAFMGRPVDGEVVSTAGHSGVVEYEPTELVVTARAGTPLAEVEEVLARHDQCLGCEPPHFGNATIGGTLACNQSGPARPWLGSIRDHVLGLRLINGHGEHLHFGGRVMKNVAGYDVSRLQAGALGTLGLVTEVTLRVFPRPEFAATVALELDSPAALAVMSEEARQGGTLNGACWISGRLYLRYAGLEAAVSAQLRRIGGDVVSDGDAFWRGVREQQHEFFAGEQPLWRITARPAAAHGPEGDWLLDWGGAQRWLRRTDDRTALEQLAEGMGGQVSLYRGGDRLGEVLHRRSPGQQRLHQALKRAFDPQGLFNPGRLYSWM